MQGPFQRFAPLFVLVAVELAWCGYLTFARVIPAGHDGLQYFYLKHFVFSAVVSDGEFPLWFPYVAHGVPSTWWSMLQSGVFDPLGLAAARLVQPHDFLPLFYALLFAEKVLLITGTWLFASEHFRARPAIFAVTAAVAGSAIWYTQPWWNFHAIVALPMMLFLLHRTITAFRWTWLVAFGLLLFLQTFGQPLYYLPMTLLFLTVYAVVTLSYPEPATFRSRLSFSVVGLAALAAVMTAFATELVWLRRASAEMAFGGGRGPDGTVPLETFLNDAGYTDFRSWNQFFSSLTPHLDVTLFAGFLMAGLLVVTFCSGPLNRVQRIFAWLTVAALLICSASPFDTIIYYFWPLARSFRRLVLLAPVTKFFAVLLCGATLDRLVTYSERPRVTGRTLLVSALALGAWLVLLVLFAFNAGLFQQFLAAMTTEGLPVLNSYGVDDVGRRLSQAIVFLSVTIAMLGGLLAAVKRWQPALRWGWAVAILLLVDVTAYRQLEMRTRTVALTRVEVPIFNLAELPYVSRRLETPDASINPRRALLARVSRLNVGQKYWTENLLWQTDTYRSDRRSVYWSSALDTLLHAVSTDTDHTAPEHNLPPSGTGPLSVIGGVRAPKARLLGRVMVCPDDGAAARVLTSPEFQGQVALVTLPPDGPERGPVFPSGLSPMACDPAELPGERAEASRIDVARERDASAVRSVNFSANRAEFDVENGPRPAVFAYSDAWNEHWQARVNGNVATVLHSDLAYKAVIVPPGKSRVVFEYRDRLADLVFLLQELASGSFVAILITLAIRRRTESRFRL